MPTQCTRCTPTVLFDSEHQLKFHKLEYHSDKFYVTVRTSCGSDCQLLVVQASGGGFPCPLGCGATELTKTRSRRHIKEHEKDPITKASCDAANSVAKQSEAVPLLSELSESELLDDEKDVASVCAVDHDHGVLASCGILHASNAEKIKTLVIVESMGLVPFVLGSRSKRTFALTHSDNIKELSFGSQTVCSVDLANKKRRLEDSICCVCASTSSTPGLEDLRTLSPYARKLSTRTFIELSDEAADILNSDWRFEPQLRYACAKALAGCILYNTSNGQAIMINTIEVYGRKATIDAHRERFSIQKGTPTLSSLPPETARYKNVWPVTFESEQGDELLIGTQVFNALVTCCIRLDEIHEPSVGGSSSDFRLTSSKDSMATKIFVDVECLEEAKRIAEDRTVDCVSRFNKVEQLRQLRTKFDDQSTFSMCRASGPITDRHTCQPFTIYSLADYDRGTSDDCKAASSLFQDVAMSAIRALEESSRGTLTAAHVTELQVRCGKNKAICQAMSDVQRSFGDKDHVEILKNKELSHSLSSLANALSSHINSANKTVSGFIKQRFLES